MASIEINDLVGTLIAFVLSLLMVITFLLGAYVYSAYVIFWLLHKAFNKTKAYKRCIAFIWYYREFQLWLKTNDRYGLMEQLNKKNSKL